MVVAAWSASALFAALSILRAQDSSAVACRPETPVGTIGARVTLRAFAPASPDRTATYRWRVTAGTIAGDGATVEWQLPSQPQTYAATVEVSGAATGSCTLHVVALRGESQRGTEIRRKYLAPNDKEEPGAHLYSYLLFGSRPLDQTTRERYLAALEAYVAILPVPDGIVPPRDLNVTVLPVAAVPSTAAETDAELLLKQYDWERARFFLQRLPGDHLAGPYIISSNTPLSRLGLLKQDYLFQDLSIVPPALINSWVREFMLQSAQEQFWTERTGPMLALKMRTAIGVLSAGLPNVRSVFAITWR